MDDSLGDVRHTAGFKVVMIPRDMGDPIEEIALEPGTSEKQFRRMLQLHFGRDRLLDREEDALAQDLAGKVKGGAGGGEGGGDAAGSASALIRHAVTSTNASYEIIPLTLPTPGTRFRGINLYIDSVGRVKNLPTNARASRIASDDVRGDVFISTTVDDGEDFRRVDFTAKHFDFFMQHPPSKEGRWNSQLALAQMLKEGRGATASPAAPPPLMPLDEDDGKPPKAPFVAKTYP